MSDTITVDNGVGTRARVALDLMKFLIESKYDDYPQDKITLLNLYVDCLNAANGSRPK